MFRPAVSSIARGHSVLFGGPSSSVAAVRFMSSRLPTDLQINSPKVGRSGRSTNTGLTVAVFGATGMLGRYVVNRLGRTGNQVIIPHRGNFEDDHRHLKVMGDLGQIIPMEFNIRDEESIRDILKYSHVVVNLMGANRETMNYKFEDVHMNAVETISRIAKESGVERFYHVSALGAPQFRQSEFFRTKHEGEKILRSHYPDAVVFRPATMYSLEDHFLNLYTTFGRLFNIVPVVGVGMSAVQPVHVADVASAIVKTIFDNSHAGATFELGGPDVLTWRAVLTEIFSVFNPRERPMIVGVPAPILNFYATILEKIPFIDSLNREFVYLQTVDNTTNPNLPGFSDLGIEPLKFDVGLSPIVKQLRRLDTSDLAQESENLNNYFTKI